MAETRKLLRADLKTETYSYLIEQTAGHLTVAKLTRTASGGWKYAVTTRRLDAADGNNTQTEALSPETSDYATPDEAIAAARTHARNLLAG